MVVPASKSWIALLWVCEDFATAGQTDYVAEKTVSDEISDHVDGSLQLMIGVVMLLVDVQLRAR